MTNGTRRPRRQRPPAPRGVLIGVGAVLSATGGTLLTVAAAGILGGGALVTTAFAGGPPHAAVQAVARPAHVALPAPNPPAPPAVAPAANPPAAAPVANPPANPPAVGGSSDHGGSGSAPLTASAPARTPVPPVTAAAPPAPAPRLHPAAVRAIAVPVTGAAGGAASVTGLTLLGAGTLLILNSLGGLRRRPPGPRPFDDELPPYW